MNDEELKKLSHEQFATEASAKFDAGMREHNPNGDKGLMRMTPLALANSIAEEVIDQWHYVTALRQRIITLHTELDRLHEENATLRKELLANGPTQPSHE